jgi:hypothetical protein
VWPLAVAFVGFLTLDVHTDTATLTLFVISYA